MSDTAGYSGKPLWAKLGVKPGDRVLAIDPPPHYGVLVAPLPDGAVVLAETDSPDIVHAFVRSRAELLAAADRLTTLPRAGGMLWVSWPKKSSPLFGDLTEDGVREFLLPTGWVDVKVCAVDADWSGLKLLKRKG